MIYYKNQIKLKIRANKATVICLNWEVILAKLIQYNKMAIAKMIKLSGPKPSYKPLKINYENKKVIVKITKFVQQVIVSMKKKFTQMMQKCNRKKVQNRK